MISALSFRYNPGVALAALNAGANYFDLTEDIDTAAADPRVGRRRPDRDRSSCRNAAWPPASSPSWPIHLTRPFDSLDTVHMRVGALPQFPSNALNYNLTWSTDGLINEYCNPCQAIHEGRAIEVLAAGGPGVVFPRRRALRGLQHLRRPGHALRNPGRPRPRAELPHHPLSGAPRPDGLPAQRSAPGPAAGDAQRHPRKGHPHHPPGRGGHLLQRHRLAGRAASCN